MTTRYGTAISNSLGTSPNSGVIASCSCRASVNPNSSAPPIVGQTPQRPKMTRAMHTQPRPLTMSIVKLPRVARVRNEPPSAISTPPHVRATYLVAVTEIPATSAASGFSPTARRRIPAPVERNTHHSSGAITRNTTYVGGYWARMSRSSKIRLNFGDRPCTPVPYSRRLV